MDFLLRQALSADDIDFLNQTNVEYKLINIDSGLGIFNSNDSGWCDWATGARIVTSTDRVVFLDVEPPDALVLKIKYVERLRTLPHGFVEDIYNIAQQHNTDPVTVFDNTQGD